METGHACGDACGEAGEVEETELLAPEWPNAAYYAGRGLASRGKILGQVNPCMPL